MPTTVSSKEYKSILKTIDQIYDHNNETALREYIAQPLLELLDADFFASFIWDEKTKTYHEPVYLNMDGQNIGIYLEYYQYRDPITRRLAHKTKATSVDEIMDYSILSKTEFFNDFLTLDGLNRGINLHLYNKLQNIGDLRIWRKKGKPAFDTKDCTILELLKPHLIRAIVNIKIKENNTHPMEQTISEKCLLFKKLYFLSKRELQIVELLMKGDSDHSISNKLSIEESTVRTHIRSIFRKTGINNRNKLLYIN